MNSYVETRHTSFDLEAQLTRLFFFPSLFDKGLKSKLDLLESRNKYIYLLRREKDSKAIILLL